MNWDHIKAVMVGSYKKVATVGDQRVLTNGHMMFLVDPGSPLIGTADEFPKAAELWKGALTVSVEAQPFGSLCEVCGYHYRSIGTQCVAERYVRCFNAPGVTWTHSLTHMLVHDSGKLVAVVMPCKPVSQTVCESQDIPDSEIVSPYASADNDWYLSNKATLRARIEEAEEEREAAESKRDDLEAEVNELNDEIASLEKRLAGIDRTASAEAGKDESPK